MGKETKPKKAKTFKKKADPVKTTAELEAEQGEQKDLECLIEGKGLRLAWIRFIDEYIKNGGNGTKAYQKAYPNTSEDTAGVNASRLLGNARIKAELNNKLGASEVTEDFIIEGLKGIAQDYRGEKTIMAAVRCYEILGKIKGMLVDTKKVAFTTDNPALFTSKVSDEEKKVFAEKVAKGERITE